MKRRNVLLREKVERELVAAGWYPDHKGLVGNLALPDCGECMIVLDDVHHEGDTTFLRVSIYTPLSEKPNRWRQALICNCSQRHSIVGGEVVEGKDRAVYLRLVFQCEVTKGIVFDLIQMHAIMPFWEFMQLYRGLDDRIDHYTWMMFLLDGSVSDLH